jgi:hypothetical protein
MGHMLATLQNLTFDNCSLSMKLILSLQPIKIRPQLHHKVVGICQ